MTLPTPEQLIAEALRAQCMRFHDREPMANCRDAIDETRPPCVICAGADALASALQELEAIDAVRFGNPSIPNEMTRVEEFQALKKRIRGLEQQALLVVEYRASAERAEQRIQELEQAHKAALHGQFEARHVSDC